MCAVTGRGGKVSHERPTLRARPRDEFQPYHSLLDRHAAGWDGSRPVRMPDDRRRDRGEHAGGSGVRDRKMLPYRLTRSNFRNNNHPRCN